MKNSVWTFFIGRMFDMCQGRHLCPTSRDIIYDAYRRKPVAFHESNRSLRARGRVPSFVAGVLMDALLLFCLTGLRQEGSSSLLMQQWLVWGLVVEASIALAVAGAHRRLGVNSVVAGLVHRSLPDCQRTCFYRLVAMQYSTLVWRCCWGLWGAQLLSDAAQGEEWEFVCICALRLVVCPLLLMKQNRRNNAEQAEKIRGMAVSIVMSVEKKHTKASEDAAPWYSPVMETLGMRATVPLRVHKIVPVVPVLDP